YNPDLNIFMMCDKVNPAAYQSMPAGYHIRHIREDELEFWKHMHIDTDDSTTQKEFGAYMSEYFERVYAPKGDLFYKSCLMAVNDDDEPVATCFAWKAYGRYTTIHWYKTIKAYEGKGIGRALLSAVMQSIASDDYPVYLHTQSGSFRAIHLYTDFGFRILKDAKIGNRNNEIEEALPILKELMPEALYNQLLFDYARQEFLDVVSKHETNEF
ncbi:MAG: GNAT family N-acetyltransferase, partial [Oscillospiraceae bacterium]|nr:GNAT family N-acetyltransferase [Oscillospiraceae bacterium]